MYFSVQSHHFKIQMFSSFHELHRCAFLSLLWGDVFLSNLNLKSQYCCRSTLIFSSFRELHPPAYSNILLKWSQYHKCHIWTTCYRHELLKHVFLRTNYFFFSWISLMCLDQILFFDRASCTNNTFEGLFSIMNHWVFFSFLYVQIQDCKRLF